MISLRARLNGKDIDLSIKEFFKQSYFEVSGEVDPGSVGAINRVELDFNGVFDVALDIERNRQQRQTRILSTLQKNNRSRWIKDWIRYYREYFDIDAVVLYDNGSENIDLPNIIFGDHGAHCSGIDDGWHVPDMRRGRSAGKIEQIG